MWNNSKKIVGCSTKHLLIIKFQSTFCILLHTGGKRNNVPTRGKNYTKYLVVTSACMILKKYSTLSSICNLIYHFCFARFLLFYYNIIWRTRLMSRFWFQMFMPSNKKPFWRQCVESWEWTVEMVQGNFFLNYMRWQIFFSLNSYSACRGTWVWYVKHQQIYFFFLVILSFFYFLIYYLFFIHSGIWIGTLLILYQVLILDVFLFSIFEIHFWLPFILFIFKKIPTF